MGISGLLPLLKSIQVNTHIKHYAGKVVGVDAYVWLHKGAFSCTWDLAMGKETTKFPSHLEMELIVGMWTMRCIEFGCFVITGWSRMLCLMGIISPRNYTRKTLALHDAQNIYLLDNVISLKITGIRQWNISRNVSILLRKWHTNLSLHCERRAFRMLLLRTRQMHNLHISKRRGQ